MSTRETSKGPAGMAAKPITIMIVEDNAVNMMLLRSVIEIILPQARIVEAEDGQVAVEKFKIGSPDLIFMDIRMPNKNGYEATTEIRRLETGTGIPIIALTAGTANGERERCLEAGMNDYISKPIVQNSIQNALIKWLSLGSSPIFVPPEAASSSSHFNEAELRDRLGNNEDVLARVLSATKAGMKKCLVDLHKDSQGDIKALSETAHKLKGIALSASFHQLADLAGQLEEVQLSETEKIAQLLKEITSEIEYLNTVLN